MNTNHINKYLLLPLFFIFSLLFSQNKVFAASYNFNITSSVSMSGVAGSSLVCTPAYSYTIAVTNTTSGGSSGTVTVKDIYNGASRAYDQYVNNTGGYVFSETDNSTIWDGVVCMNTSGLSAGTYSDSIQYAMYKNGLQVTGGKYMNISLTLTAPSCSGQSGSVSVSPSGINVGSTATLSATAGWTSVNYSSSNSGIASVSGTQATGVASGTATISATGTAPNGATGCSLTSSSVSVKDFTVGASPTYSLSTVAESTSAQIFNINVGSLNTFNSAVTLSVLSGCPAGATCSLQSSTVTPPSNSTATTLLTVTPGGSFSNGTYNIIIRGVSGSLTRTGTATMTVSTVGPNLTASAPTPSTATTNVPLTFSSTVTNGGNGSTNGSFYNFFQVSATGNGGGGFTDLASVQMSTLAASGTSTTTSPSYTFTSAGTYSVRACADKTNSASAGTITETNEGDNCSAWTNVTVTNAPVPVVSISASPASGYANIINPTITWSATNSPTSCTATGDWSGSKSSSGSQSQGVLSVAKTYTYTLTCSNVGGSSAPASASVIVTSVAPISVSISASPTSMTLPTNSTLLSWTTTGSPDSCTSTNGSAGWAGSKSTTSGSSQNMTGLSAGTYTYTITCSKAGTSDSTSSVNVTVTLAPATASISASPNSIYTGQTTTLTWSSSNSISCVGTNFSTGNATSGSIVLSPKSTTTYQVTCNGVVGQVTATVTVKHKPSVIEN